MSRFTETVKSFLNLSPRTVNIDNRYLSVFETLDGQPLFNEYGDCKLKRYDTVFSSPALLKVFCLQCDLFSLGKIYVYKGEDEITDDPALRLLANPNPMQSQSQFLWDYMFHHMMGVARCYVDSNIVENEDNKLYFLDSHKLEFPYSITQRKDKLVFSSKTLKDINDTNLTYRYEDGTTITFPLSKLITITDLTNGNGNWFEGNSRIDALRKIIANSEASLDATNINTRYSGKFLVAGQADPKDVSKLPLTNDEKTDIESKMNGRKQVHAVKSLIDIKRFVENMASLELGKSYLESYYLIGAMYNIPKDVLEAYQTGATFENQEKATAKHVSYTLQPKGNDFLEALGKRFGYDKQGKKIIIDWNHLPFMQVFEKARVSNQRMQIATLTEMLKLGMDLEECNQFLDTTFTKAKYEQPKPTTPAGSAGTGTPGSDTGNSQAA